MLCYAINIGTAKKARHTYLLDMAMSSTNKCI